MKPEKTSWKKFNRLRFSKKSLNRHVKKIEKGTVRHANKFVTSRLDRLSGVRRNISMWIVLIVLLVLASALQWGSFRDSYTDIAHGSGGAYSEGVLGPVETLNPLFAKSSAEKSAARLLFSSLYQYDETGHLKGDLAKDVKINDQETEYVVNLKEGLKWSDGSELNADDVVFTVNLIKNPQVSSITGWDSVNVEKIDNLAVKFTLSATYAPFAHSLTFPVLPRHVLEKIPVSDIREGVYSSSPSVTSGPFALRLVQDSVNDGTKKIIHMTANPYYHGGLAKLERFQLYVYPNKDDIAKALRTNEIIGTPELVYNSLDDQIKNRYVSSSYSINDAVYALLNSRSQVLSSQAVRRALAYSINSAEVRQELDLSTKELNGPVLENHIDGKMSSIPKKDTKKAKQLLEDEGWKLNGNKRSKNGQDLKLSIVALKGSEYEEISNILAKTWKEDLNIETEVRIVDQTDTAQNILTSVLKPRNFDVLIYELVIGGDPDVYAYWHSSQTTPTGHNFANYSNIVADDALESGRGKATPVQRSNRYKLFVQRWQADMPAIPLYQPRLDYIQLESVQTIDKNTEFVYPTDRYANVIYWSVQRERVYKTP